MKPLDRVSLAAMRPPFFTRLPGLSSEQVEVRGQRVLITGASSGIGEAGARCLAAAGAHVVLVARRVDQLEHIAGQIAEAGGSASWYSTDLTDGDAIDELVATVEADLGGVDVLVNNAGHSIRRPVLKSRMHDYERLIDINYLGPVRLTLGLLPGMVARGQGHLINVATWGVLLPGAAKFGGYVASKSALTAFGDSVRAELERKGIAVTTLYFPLVATPMIAPTEAYQDKPALSADEAGEWMLRAVRTRPAEIAPRISHLARAIGAAAPGAARHWVTRAGF